jgi:hypothetical protein
MSPTKRFSKNKNLISVHTLLKFNKNFKIKFLFEFFFKSLYHHWKHPHLISRNDQFGWKELIIVARS